MSNSRNKTSKLMILLKMKKIIKTFKLWMNIMKKKENIHKKIKVKLSTKLKKKLRN